MTTDNQKKYEAAAREYSEGNGLSMNIKSNAYNSFLAGASFAEKDGWNAAIDKAIDLAYNSGLGDFAVEIGKLKI